MGADSYEASFLQGNTPRRLKCRRGLGDITRIGLLLGDLTLTEALDNYPPKPKMSHLTVNGIGSRFVWSRVSIERNDLLLLRGLTQADVGFVVLLGRHIKAANRVGRKAKIKGGRVELVASFSCPGMAFCLLVVGKLVRLREKRSILDLILKTCSLRLEVYLGSHPQDVFPKNRGLS